MTTATAVYDASDLAWRASPAGYAARFEPNFTRPAHIDLIGRHLRDVVAGRTDRLIVTMPPRHAKSTTISHYGCVWALDLHPEWRIMLGSYEATFAQEWGWKVRSSIAENARDLRVRLAPDSQARAAWHTTAGGAMYTAGVGGPFTGRGANLFIVDDPFKGFEDSHSAVMRERVWNWYQSTVYSRLQKGGRIIVVMTRWHEDDLVGRLKRAEKEGGDTWVHLDLPAIADVEGDALGRPMGAALWPEQYDEEALARIERAISPYLYAGLYQQKPAPPKGTILQRGWWKYYTGRLAPNQYDEMIQSWDMAFKDEKSSSYVVGQVWGRVGAEKHLLYQVRDRMDFPSTITAIRNVSAKWPRAVGKYVEDKANGPAIIATLSHELEGLIAWPANDSKIARAHAAAPQVRAGNVFLPDPQIAPWVVDFVEEAAVFPNGMNDDQVDAFTQALAAFGHDETIGGTSDEYTDTSLTGRR